LIKSLAEQGDKMGQLALGKLYYFGKGVKTNYEEALNWLKLSAKQGVVESQFLIGHYHYKKQNYKEATEWFLLTNVSHLFATSRQIRSYENH